MEGMENIYKTKKIIIIALIIIVIGAVILSIKPKEKEVPIVPDNVYNGNVEDVTPPVSTVDEKTFVETYIKSNIVTIATNSAVLGGTWYVVSTELNIEANTGEVTYEDGHIQSTATFAYLYQENPQSVTVTKWEVEE